MKFNPAIVGAVLLAACAASPSVSLKPTDVKPKPVAVPNSSRPALDAAESVAVSGFYNNSNVNRFIRYEAAQGRMGEQAMRNFFSEVQYKGNIINIMNRPGTSLPWYQFQRNNSGAQRIRDGQAFYQQNRMVIDSVAKAYGVPSEIIVAIVGIETNYGRNMGSFRVADALSTLAFDYPRRAEFFQNELSDFLQMAQQEKRDAFSFKGSYAGAMGMPQFMPSSFLKYAVDYDGDGYRDIWNNVGDVAASVANYLKQHGWQSGGKMIVPVSLTPTQELQNIIDEKTALTRTVADFKKLGVVPQEVVSDQEKAVLYRLETAPGVYEYFLGLNNFYTVWQYNHSRMYVTAVRNIANGVSGRFRL